MRLTNDYKKSAFQWDFSDSEDDVFDYDADKSHRRSSANSTKKQKASAKQTDNVCCPRGFRQDKKEGPQLQRRNSNQYKKSAYVWNFSDSEEDDFV